MSRSPGVDELLDALKKTQAAIVSYELSGKHLPDLQAFDRRLSDWLRVVSGRRVLQLTIGDRVLSLKGVHVMQQMGGLDHLLQTRGLAKEALFLNAAALLLLKRELFSDSHGLAKQQLVKLRRLRKEGQYPIYIGALKHCVIKWTEEFRNEIAPRRSPIMDAVLGAPAFESLFQKASTSSVRGVFRREGKYWKVGIGGVVASEVRHSQAMGFIQYLLRHPGKDISSLALFGAGAPAVQALASRNQAGEVMTREALGNLLRRRSAIGSDLPRCNDPAVIVEWEDEKASIEKELLRYPNKDKQFKDPLESARQNVQKQIKAALKKLPLDLQKHLRPPVLKTGACCSYNPDEPAPTWAF